MMAWGGFLDRIGQPLAAGRILKRTHGSPGSAFLWCRAAEQLGDSRLVRVHQLGVRGIVPRGPQ